MPKKHTVKSINDNLSLINSNVIEIWDCGQKKNELNLRGLNAGC